MKSISALNPNISLTENKKISTETITITVPKQAIKSATMLAASMLTLAALGKSDISINNTYQNEVTKVSYTHKNNDRVMIQPQKNYQNKSPMSDEEIMHRLAIGFSLVGFFTPLIMSIFSDHKEKIIMNKFC